MCPCHAPLTLETCQRPCSGALGVDARRGHGGRGGERAGQARRADPAHAEAIRAPGLSRERQRTVGRGGQQRPPGARALLHLDRVAARRRSDRAPGQRDLRLGRGVRGDRRRLDAHRRRRVCRRQRTAAREHVGAERLLAGESGVAQVRQRRTGPRRCAASCSGCRESARPCRARCTATAGRRRRRPRPARRCREAASPDPGSRRSRSSRRRSRPRRR